MPTALRRRRGMPAEIAAPVNSIEPTLEIDPKVQHLLTSGCAVVKHNLNGSKRVRKWLTLSNDCLTLKWRTIGESEGAGAAQTAPLTPRSPSLFTPRESASSILLSDVQMILYGPFSANFARKSTKARVDKDYNCFSLALRTLERTIDFAFEDEATALPWLAGIQQLVTFFAEVPPEPRLCWTLSKLRVQRLRLKVAAEIEVSEHQDAARVLAGIARDAADGIYAKEVVATEHVVIDMKAIEEERICQRV